ncbi:hypothetical protein WJX73_010919 [Symbiochloris irregularis]|uniref:Uncharacterized protein n=1 Tax=Symbiochloris irregularis TaxID=706552 RepID=A0AAW1PG32_9CHLO
MSDPGRAYLYNSSSKQQASNPQNKHRRSSSWAKGGSNQPDLPGLPRQGSQSLSRQGSALRNSSHEPHLLAPAAAAPPLRAEGSPQKDLRGPDRWDLAVGNLEDARVAFDVIARAVEDAVYLDEEAYKQVQPTMQFTVRLQAQQHRITELEQQLDEANERLLVVEHACQESQKQASALQEELDSNAEVFKMHYGELLAKEDELSKLRVVVQALSGR